MQLYINKNNELYEAYIMCNYSTNIPVEQNHIISKCNTFDYLCFKNKIEFTNYIKNKYFPIKKICKLEKI